MPPVIKQFDGWVDQTRWSAMAQKVTLSSIHHSMTSEFDSKDPGMSLFFTDILTFLQRRKAAAGREPRIHRLDLERLSEHELRDLNLHEKVRRKPIGREWD